MTVQHLRRFCSSLRAVFCCCSSVCQQSSSRSSAAQRVDVLTRSTDSSLPPVSTSSHTITNLSNSTRAISQFSLFIFHSTRFTFHFYTSGQLQIFTSSVRTNLREPATRPPSISPPFQAAAVTSVAWPTTKHK
uniref:(northern house mosquito) hypothetical protein n=1 Tax=Culex pipiens TaxID=7175 RepID=A0A8D8IUU6_CULPI